MLFELIYIHKILIFYNRKFWRRNNAFRMGVFWIGSLLTLVTVILIIATDWITWDRLNRGFVASTGTISLFTPPQCFEVRSLSKKE